MLAFTGTEWAAIIGGILTGIAAIITAWAAVVKAKREGHDECHEELRAARAEAEQLATELHAERMRDV